MAQSCEDREPGPRDPAVGPHGLYDLSKTTSLTDTYTYKITLHTLDAVNSFTWEQNKKKMLIEYFSFRSFKLKEMFMNLLITFLKAGISIFFYLDFVLC